MRMAQATAALRDSAVPPRLGMVTGWVTHSLTCGVRPRPSLPTTRTEPLESEGRGDGEPQRFCPSNRAPTTGIGRKVGIEHFGAEKAAHGALHHFGVETGDGAIAADDAPHTEPVGGADDGAQIAGILQVVQGQGKAVVAAGGRGQLTVQKHPHLVGCGHVTESR